jgi:2-amino-4-hydroxy-6-hydroxymethyldihydropteridine diphosphokinase
MSAVYETEPQGLRDQPWFVNQVVRLAADPVIWSPEGVLSTLQAVEAQMGRTRGEPDGPRVMDIDLLLFGDRVMQGGYLTLPHPRMRERAFVLVPLFEIAPDLVFPDGVALRQALAQVRHRVEGNRIWQEQT